MATLDDRDQEQELRARKRRLEQDLLSMESDHNKLAHRVALLTEEQAKAKKNIERLEAEWEAQEKERLNLQRELDASEGEIKHKKHEINAL